MRAACCCGNTVGVMCGVVCEQVSVRRSSGAYVRCGMCTLDGPSVLVADGLGLGASRPRLHNAPSHACHADRRVARVRAIV